MSARKKVGGSKIPVLASSPAAVHSPKDQRLVTVGSKRACQSNVPPGAAVADDNLELGHGRSTRRQKRANEDDQWISPSDRRMPSPKTKMTSSPDVIVVEEIQSSSPKARDLGGTRTNSGKGLDQLKRLQLATKQDSQNKELARQVKAIKFQGTSWVERNYPSGLGELFVHKKKIEEVQSWLKGAYGLEGQSNYRSKICVLTGPSGSGKTATVFLAAKELNIEIKEWINPMSLTDFNFDRLGKFDADEVQSRSQQDLFSNFLFRASQYPSLPIKGRPRFQHRLVLVEDFPNVFFRDTALFHSILRSYNNLGGCPVVFIVPDSTSSDSNCSKLFPKNIMQELNIAYISLNAIAVTLMVKFLINMCSTEGISIDKSAIEGIAIASGGDIRCAINTLQFKLMKEKQPASSSEFKVPMSKVPKLKLPSKGKVGEKSETVQKDETLFLFRALGKILYSKRDDCRNVEMHSNVPESSFQYLRPHPLQENPESLIDKIETQAETFLNFLQQNYLPFFGSLEDIVAASSILADSEYLLSNWPFDDSGSGSKSYKIREAREEIALLTAARGIMYSNVKRMPNTWRPLKKPMFGDVKSRIQNSAEAVKHLFVTEGAVQLNFYSEILPYYAKLTVLHPRLWVSDQKRFIGEIGTLKKGHRLRINHDTLQERDAFEDSGSDAEDSEPSGKSKTETNATPVGGNKSDTFEVINPDKLSLPSVEESEEEFMIEEYED